MSVPGKRSGAIDTLRAGLENGHPTTCPACANALSDVVALLEAAEEIAAYWIMDGPYVPVPIAEITALAEAVRQVEGA